MVLAPLLLLAVLGTSQSQYFIHLSGHHTPCTPDVQNGFVNVASLPGTIPAYNIDVPINSNCYYTVSLELNSLEYGFSITSGCATPITTIVGDVLPSAPPLGTIVNMVTDFDCGQAPLDCEPAFDMAQTMDGGAPVPFSLSTTNMSYGTSPFEFFWSIPGVGNYTETAPVLEFPGEGLYLVCLSLTDADGCGGLTCDSVWFDTNGNMSLTQPCQACFTVTQASGGGMLTPFTANFSSCSSGGVSPYTYTWWMPDGTSLSQENETWVFPGEGAYAVCLNITDASSCFAAICDSVFVDASGNISNTPTDCPLDFTVSFTTTVSGNTVSFNSTSSEPDASYYWNLGDGNADWGPFPQPHTYADGGPYTVCLNAWTWNGVDTCFADPFCLTVGPFGTGIPDCLQIPGGPNLPGTPCNNPATGPGIWDSDCECVPNTPLPCEAGFWVIQAYTMDTVNPGGIATPIPYELWVWNLSVGNSPFQYLWDFGDGNTSTDPFPTHVYANSGPYQLCLTMTDASGCQDTYCEEISVDSDGMLGLIDGLPVRAALTINVLQQLPTGIDDTPGIKADKLWPNPVVDHLNLTLNSSRSGNLQLSIVDMKGRELRRTNVGVIAGGNQLPVEVQGLEPGMYLLRLENGNNSAVLRFVKN